MVRPVPALHPDPSAAAILLVEDDRVVRRIVTTKLTGLGHSVEVAEDGREALERLTTGAVPDLVITDQLMPRLNGLQLLREIRADPRLVTLPVIMLTSKGSERDVVAGLHAGLDDYVAKPFSADELAARVLMVLRRAGRRTQ